MGVTQLSREVHIFLHPSIHLFIHLLSKIKCLQWLVSEVRTVWSNEGRSVRPSSSVEHTINYWLFSLSKVSFLSSFPSNAPSHILLTLDLCASHGILSNKKLSFGISYFMLSSSFFFLLQTPCFFEKPLCHRSRVPWWGHQSQHPPPHHRARKVTQAVPSGHSVFPGQDVGPGRTSDPNRASNSLL